ncbi:hypothetical protein [Clostridioides difficile]|uniref:hypothetical protein n=1 Tax=Clostridioides difficile TaxID=1496 RepID=UPI000D1F689A|nr:hypothetical protein [Clostridioides difficile]HBE9444515.1 hypothetical protein [Clostridioides difficile]
MKSLEFLRRQKMLKETRNEFASKEKEQKLIIELTDKIGDYLDNNDSIMIEVDVNAVVEFMNILNNFTSIYDFMQVDKNKFIFYNKELKI